MNSGGPDPVGGIILTSVVRKNSVRPLSNIRCGPVLKNETLARIGPGETAEWRNSGMVE